MRGWHRGRTLADPRFLLDSNIGVYLLRGEAPYAERRVAASEAGSIVISAICVAEMLIRSDGPHMRGFGRLLANIAIVPFDEAAAEAYGRLPFKRRSYDRLVAAHALTLGLTVITANLIDFSDLPDLRAENWMLP